ILMEDVKHEQLLMLTFTRAAATEFKKRLLKLIGSTAYFIEIKTFHSYCFDLLGRMGSTDESEHVITNAVEKIKNGEVEPSWITKTVLLIDEAQDMDREVFALVKALMAYNEEMRVIAVGDDDQNIFGFRGSSAKYLKQFMAENQATTYELLENFRSKRNLVHFTNQFAASMQERFKRNEIMAHSQDNGKIRIINYTCDNLLTPFVADLSRTDLTGSTCVLTVTNDEALQVTGMLLERGIPAQLIQTNAGFNLFDLVEVRYFMANINADAASPLIDQDVWERAQRALSGKYGNSKMFEICKRIIRDFDTVYPKRKYKTDFELFIKESGLEDFYPESRETVLVSTIHKAKGREFDNVFLMLPNFLLNTEEKKRQLYVAMTRAKNNLVVHLKGSYLNQLRAENLTRVLDRRQYQPPERLAIQLGHEDVWLDYFIERQDVIMNLRSGDPIQYKNGEWVTKKGIRLFRPSKKFTAQMNRLQSIGYLPEYASANFIVLWRKAEEEKEFAIVLPAIYFRRQKD
ncbi:MAG TPA: ATP-dependent helicase, partial [Firmicutes bacterium]|nr:ATP-dependent helicase [Bacillota bacterium]